MYAGRRKAGDSKRGKKKPTGGGLRKDATVKSGEVYKINFILFIFTGRKLGCRMLDVSELDFSSSEEKFLFSAAIVTHSIRWNLFIH